MNKSKIIDLIIKNQKDWFVKIQESANIYKTSSDLDEDNTLDPEDFSHQVEASEMQLHLEEKLKNEGAKIERLENFKNTIHDSIEEGTLIETDLAYLYFGFAGNPLTINGKEVYCVSMDAPVAKKLLHIKIGDTFKIGTVEHRILYIT